MRIAFDAKRAFHNKRGLGNYSRDTIRLAAELYPGDEQFLFNPSGNRNLDFLPPANCLEINPTSFIFKAIPSLWRSSGLCRDLNKIQPDLYHGLSQELPFGIHKTGVPSVVTMHDAIFMRYPELYSASYRNIFIQKNRYACNVATRILAISEQTKRDIITYFEADERKIDVIYQGCSSAFRVAISEQKKQDVRVKYNLPDTFLLTVGAIEKRKNALLILEALAHKKLSVPLIIAGRPTDYVHFLKKRILELNLQNQVLFIENADSEDLPALYSLATIFVLPSYFEGFGIPVLEALCCGTPVVASSGSCFEETGGPDSCYVSPDDPGELGEILDQLLSDPGRLNLMREKGLQYAEQFSDQNIAAQLNTFYNKTLQK